MKIAPKRLRPEMKNPIIFYKWETGWMKIGRKQTKKNQTQLQEKKSQIHIFKRSTAAGSKK